MSRQSRNQRSTSEYDDYDDGSDGFSRDAGQEKLKQLGFDLLARWHWIVLGLILGTLGGLYYLSKAPKKYDAVSTVLLKQQISSVISKDQVDKMNLSTVEAMNTIAERIRRPELMEKVAARPDIRELPGLMPPAVQWLPEWAAAWIGKKSEKPSSPSAALFSPPPPLQCWQELFHHGPASL